MRRYNPKEIEPKWQKIWEESKIYSAKLDSDKPKYIGFGMFNYPSGAGIHVGHVRNYTIPDVITRVKRQQGFEAYQPVGWDSFGLPAENFAIKTGVSPQESTKKAIEKYQKQYRAMGWAVDWDKKINTTDPEYYKWTQWTFLKLFENKLAYQKESAQWWCPHDKTVLADEQVEAGRCWRCGHIVERKNLKQWFFKITEYADEILEATDDLDWTEAVKASQRAWIGKSQGVLVDFKIAESDDKIQVFTTRIDTIYGATYLVLAPEHPLVGKITTPDQKGQVDDYIQQATRKSDLERQEGEKNKTGVFTGSYAINPANGEKIPIWVADYVLMGYGTGAIMAVPAHDERDMGFAKKFSLPIVQVFEGTVREVNTPYNFDDISDDAVLSRLRANKGLFSGEGRIINSGIYNGLQSSEAREKMVADLAKKNIAKQQTNYKMRDWLISRQRYWGAPIPIIHCSDCGSVPVAEKDLPVVLPKIEKYEPTGGNASVLASVDEWVNVDCPKCGKPAKRETDTMDGYVCSSWYFLRYLNPHDTKQAWDPKLTEKWMPVDFYNGADHATAHLLYARFFTRFFNKIGLVGTPEPFAKMVYNGKVKASDGSAFSKSQGNGVDPLEVIEQGYGADALRLYEMFAAPIELDVLWDQQGVPGAYRFLSRIWTLMYEFLDSNAEENNVISSELLRLTHKTIKTVTERIENSNFNTAISAMMELTNDLYKIKAEKGIYQSEGWRTTLESLIQLVAPFAPHVAEELWQELGNTVSVHVSPWPKWDEGLVVEEMITLAIQINGKVRSEIMVSADISDADAIEAAKHDEKIAAQIEGKTIKKQIYVPGRLVSLVV